MRRSLVGLQGSVREAVAGLVGFREPGADGDITNLAPSEIGEDHLLVSPAGKLTVHFEQDPSDVVVV